MSASERISCALRNMVYGIMAPWEGLWRGGTFGWNISPKLGFFINLCTGWLIPCLFASVVGSVGFVLGCVACVGCFAEGLRQFATTQPYSKPISRMLVDWMPSD